MDSKTEREQALVLLKYMYNHNVEHTAELAELTVRFDTGVASLIDDAVRDYENGNQKLLSALKKAEEE